MTRIRFEPTCARPAHPTYMTATRVPATGDARRKINQTRKELTKIVRKKIGNV